LSRRCNSEGNAQYERALAAQTPAPASGQSGNEMSPTNSSATNEPLAKTFLNQTGPDWPKSQKWISGSPNVEGKFVLFDLWATTNAPSRNFIPTLNDFLKKFGSQLVIVGFSNESEDEVRAVVDPNIEYSSVLDPDNELQTTLELKEFPYALLMDTNRTVRWEGNPLNKTNALTEAVLSSFLTNMPPATPPPASDASAQ